MNPSGKPAGTTPVNGLCAMPENLIFQIRIKNARVVNNAGPIRRLAVGSRNSGRKPRPNHLRALEGVRESRINRDEPLPSEATIVPPVELEPAAQAVWNRLAPDLIAKKVLTAWDVDSFATYCRVVVLFNRAAAEVESQGASVDRKYQGVVPSPAFRAMIAMQKTMSSIGSRFGLSPADRASLRIDGAPKSGADGYIR